MIEEWGRALVTFIVVIIPMMLILVKMNSKKGEETPSITKYYLGVIAFAILICKSAFMIALYTLPIWGGFLILRALFS